MTNTFLLRHYQIPRVWAQISTDIFEYHSNPFLSEVSKKRLKTKTCCSKKGCGREQLINNFYVTPYSRDESDNRRHLCKVCWDIQNKTGFVRYSDLDLVENGQEFNREQNLASFFYSPDQFKKYKEEQKEEHAKKLTEAHRRIDTYNKLYNEKKLPIAP
tara:strand:- start:42 stop:518 length:477 start_codon:yes stop_codon:yes gene_type:complete